MANNSVALGRNDGPDFFADDDPLAELARIAGYDEKPSRGAQAADASRLEPVFNLEDELLREFERYDAPRLDPADDVRLEPEVPALTAAPAVVEPHPAVLLREHFAEADPFADPESGHAVPARDMLSPAEVFSARAPSIEPDVQAAQPVAERRMPVEPSFDSNAFDLDLISELETSLAAPAPVVPAASRPSSRPPARAYEPGFRMPLANFNRAPEPLREPRSAVVPPVETVAVLAPQSAPAGEPVAELRSAWEAEFAVEAPVRAEPVKETFSPLEEPVYDVDHYSRSAPAKPAVEPAFEAPARKEPAPVEVPVAPAVARSEPAAPAVPADFAIEDDFELALDDLELDLSDLMADEPVAAVASTAPALAAKPTPEPVVSRAPDPVVSRPPEPRAAKPRPVEPRPIEPKPVMSTAAATVAPAVPAFLANSRLAAAAPAETRTPVSSAKAPPVPEEPLFDDADLFDPALLSDADDMPEAVAELNVPDLPVHEPEKPPVAHSDYDLDLDAELASFLETTNAEANAPEASIAKPSASFAASAAAPRAAKAAAPSDGLDDFERALEEDFRRSLSAPIQGRTRLEDDEEEFQAYDEPVARRPASAFVLPLSVAGLLLVAGVSGYAWFAGDSGNLSGNGAPVVIAADTDPVKMVPENPGGKTVPNQDKAVYDRVAGGALSDPKQPSLISSDEQPVDVVQKTLVPEGFPLEGEDEEMPPAVTEEARLTPGEAVPAEPAASQDQLAVMPRKVKTMIVRADGTLVEQVSDAPAAAPATAARSEKVPAAPALAEPTQTASTLAPSQVAPVSAPATAAQIANVNVASAKPETPAAATPSASVTAAAPIPATRPAEQPVKVVASVSDQGNVRPTAAPTPTAAAPTATAAIPAATAGAGGYYVQVASLPSEADAQKSYRNLSAKFGSVIGGRGVDIAKAEIAGKGTFYRVRIPAGSKDEAAALCERYRSAGGSCLIAR